MRISSLRIENLRVIESLSLAPNDRINIVTGDNGAGKTSILEAVYLAGRGRSFRHTDARPLVRSGAVETTIVVKRRVSEDSAESVLGLARGPRELRCRLDGEDVRRRSVLAEALPVQWIGSQPQAFLESGPDSRRRFLDMAMFHVEHDYLSLINEYQRILKQRNAALRSGGVHAVVIWDPRLAAVGLEISKKRQWLLTNIFDAVLAILCRWDLGFSIDYHYHQGWTNDRGLEEDLKARTAQDCRQGFTSRGPHRAELEIRCAEGLAEKVLSRGQQKMLVIAIHLATMDMIARHRATRLPILLLDDLASELDFENRTRIVDAIVERDCQAFITRLSDDRLPEPPGCSTWNMEHGELK